MSTKIVTGQITRIADSSGNEVPVINSKLNVTDEAVNTVLNNIASSFGLTTPSILRKNEAAITTRNEFDLASTTYTVPAGKKFVVTGVTSSYDAQAVMYIRLKKQTGGSGAFETIYRMVMMAGGQGEATLNVPAAAGGIQIGAEGDVFKITIEAAIAKGTVFAAYTGVEI